MSNENNDNDSNNSNNNNSNNNNSNINNIWTRAGPRPAALRAPAEHLALRPEERLRGETPCQG